MNNQGINTTVAAKAEKDPPAENGIKVVHLRPWEEIVGTLWEVDKGETEVSANIGNYRIVFAIDSPEAEILENIASDSWQGKKVGFLRTDLPERPFIVHLIGEEKSGSKKLD